jgi:hypothetical protein
VTRWIFFADSKEVDSSVAQQENKFGIKISDWTPDKVSKYIGHLIVYSNNIGKNKLESKAVRKAAKLLNEILLNQNQERIKEVISLTSNPIKKSSCWFNFNFFVIEFILDEG